MHNAAFLIILGFMLVTFGFIAMLAPFAAGLQIEFVLGVLVLARAVMQLYYGFKIRNWGRFGGFYIGLGSIIMGYVSVSCASLLLVAPYSFLEYARPVICLYLLLNGGFDILHAMELKPVRGWQTMLLTGLASLVLALVVLGRWPVGGAAGLGGGIGGAFLLGGVSLVVLGWYGRDESTSAVH
jgi:uncharacterized membrane protein HdeD (DUF308 family)